MGTETKVEIALFFVSQTGLLLWTLSGMKNDVRNLLGWVKEINSAASDTRDRVLRIEGHLHINSSK